MGVAYWRVGFGQQLRGGRSCRASGGSRSSAATASRSPAPTRRYAHASNQDMLAAALDGLVARFGLAGAAGRRGRRRRGAQALAATSTSPARWCSAPGSTRTPRRTTSSRPAAPAWRRRSWSPTRSPSGRSTSGIAGGVDTTSRRAAGRQRGPAPHAARAQLRPDARRAAARSPRSCARSSRSSRRSRATPSRAPGCRWASTRRSPRCAGASTGEAQDELALASHQRLAAAYERGLLRRPDDAVPRADPRPEPAPGHQPGEARRAQAGLRHPRAGRRAGHHDRRQLVAAHRRRVHRAAGQSRSGRAAHSLPVLAWFSWSRDRRGRLRARRRGAADGPRVRGAADAGPGRADAAGLRLLRDPRGVRLAGAGHPGRLGVAGVLQGPARPGRAARRRSTATGSTSTAPRWPPGTRSPRPAGGSWPPWPSCSPRRAAGAG